MACETNDSGRHAIPEAWLDVTPQTQTPTPALMISTTDQMYLLCYTSRYLRVLRDICVLSTFYPFVLFLLMLPLSHTGDQGDWRSRYLWALLSGVAFLFSTVNFSTCFGSCLSPWLSVVFLCWQASWFVLARFGADCGMLDMQISNFVALIYIYDILWVCKILCLRCEGLVVVVYHFIGMCLGAIPIGISFCIFAISQSLEYEKNIYVTATLLGAWTVLPVFLRWVGKDIWFRGAPKCKLFVKAIWVVYVEAAFGCLGVIIFTRSPTTLMLYSFTIIPVLCLQVLRGHARFTMRLQSANSIFLYRMTLFLEVFAMLISRLSNLTLNICIGVMSLLLPTSNLAELGQWGLPGIQQRRDNFANILYGTATSIAMVCIVGVFWGILPRVWEGGVAEANADVQSSGGHGANEVSSIPGTRGSTSVPTRSWTGAWSRNRVRLHQANILVFFVAETRSFLIATHMFVYAFCVVVNNSSSYGLVCDQHI
eukprot:TRINITY_DN12823_c0_g1_i5.p1 TRINITY_DN12823_c0_g1~~TRINITY_DN12823_c0_g1_i5.p1  ORF type:complete len:489 (-),score=2.15 TRINITY_DN12823_c0_g1_i5:9-1454(-)